MSPSAIPEFFKGYGVDKTENWNKPTLVEYKPKRVEPTDVVIKNICCGLCGSDIHTTMGSWGNLKRNDLVVGHEIIGHVIAVGDKVTEFKVGDRVGVGAAASACTDCNRCHGDNEQYCIKRVGTYNSEDHFSEGYVTQGGYASHSIANQRFVFAIPEALSSEEAAPLMCAGLTVYSPLVRNIKGIKNPTVGVIGIGGLGHLAVQFAAAMGAKVVAFSRSLAKKEEAKKLGASSFIATGEEKNWAADHVDQFDFILNCASGVDGLALNDYFSVLKVNGKFVSVGLPPVTETFQVSPFSFLGSGGSLGTSVLGSKAEANEMLQLAAEKGVKPWVEKIQISEKGTEEALTRCENGDVRYRFVFTGFDKAFGN